MIVYIACYQCCNLLLNIQIFFFKIIKGLVLLVHSHKFVLCTLFLQIVAMSIVYLLSFINQLREILGSPQALPLQKDYQRYNLHTHSESIDKSHRT